jgi:hypothetical protein
MSLSKERTRPLGDHDLGDDEEIDLMDRKQKMCAAPLEVSR